MDLGLRIPRIGTVRLGRRRRGVLFVLITMALASGAAAALPRPAAASATPSDPWYGLRAAQPTGALVEREVTVEHTVGASDPWYTYRSRMTAVDATGQTVWSVAGGGEFVSAAVGQLPAALAAVYKDEYARAGVLKAFTRSGKLRFSRGFSGTYVWPMAAGPARLVWAETSADGTNRVFVRQKGRTRSLVLPVRSPRMGEGLRGAEASTDGSRMLVEVQPRTGRTERSFWLEVGSSGAPRIVAAGSADLGGGALAADGSKAIITVQPLGDILVDFGSFTGVSVPGGVYSSIGGGRLFFMGYSGAPTLGEANCEYHADVYDLSQAIVFSHIWSFHAATDEELNTLWLDADPLVRYLAGVDRDGVATTVNVGDGRIERLGGAYADVLPLSDGRLVTLSRAGAVGYVANPVAAP